MHVILDQLNELASAYFLNGCLCRTVCALLLPRDWFCVCVCVRVFMHAFLNKCVNDKLGFRV